MTEKIALAAAMVHNELVADIYPDFFTEYHDVAKAVKRLYYEQKKITPNFVRIKVGDSEAIDKIIEVYPTIDEGREAIKELAAEYKKRTTIDALKEAIKMAERHPLDVALKVLGDRINSVRSVSEKKVKTAGEVADELLIKMSKARERGPWSPLTGIDYLDQLVCGYEEGDVIVVLAGYKTGKSALMAQIVENAIETKTPSYVGSGEMQNTTILSRPMANISGHTTKEIKAGTVISDDRFLQAIDKARAAENMFICDQKLSGPQMVEHCTTYSTLYGVKLFQFDQINLFEETDKDPWQGIQNIVKLARVTANQLGIAIILYHQVNASELVKPHFRPSVTGARGGTSSLSQATKVILLHRPDHHNLVQFEDGPYKGMRSSGLMEVYVGAGNELEMGSCLVRFNGPQQSISGIDHQITCDGKVVPQPFYYGAKLEEDASFNPFELKTSSLPDDLPF